MKPSFAIHLNQDQKDSPALQSPASFGQESLWMAEKLHPEKHLYNIPIVLQIEGDLDMHLLEQSFTQLIERHAAFRTIFQSKNKKLFQVIAASVPISILFDDLSSLNDLEREITLQRLVDAEIDQPFSLTEGPLLRIKLIRLSPNNHFLTIISHHIIGDKWSEQILIRELIELYQAHTERRQAQLPDIPISYADYAKRQREEVPQLTSQLEYWRNQLSDLPELNLPTDYHPENRSYTSIVAPVELDGTIVKSLRDLGRKEGTSLFTTLLTAFKLLLSRYTSQKDITVGSPFADRNQSEIENIIGYFVNPLPLRTQFEGNPSFREAIRRVRTTLSGATQNQEIPLEVLTSRFAPRRNPDQHPLFEALFLMDNFPTEALSVSNLRFTQQKTLDEAPKFLLTMNLYLDINGVRGAMIGDGSFFEQTTLIRMSCHFKKLLTNVCKNPDTPFFTLPFLTDVEHHQIVVEWNRTDTNYPSEITLDRLFLENVHRDPSAIAIIEKEKRWTYQETDQEANRIAHLLYQNGARKGMTVGLLFDRSPELIFAMLGVLKAGCAYIPIDTKYPETRQSVMLEHASLVVTKKSYHTGKASIPVLYIENAHPVEHETPLPMTSGNDVAYVIYTSGSTGIPKGVKVPHRGVTRLFKQSSFLSLKPTDVVAQTLNPCFDASVQEIWGALTSGAQLVFIDHETLLNPSSFGRVLIKHGITAWMTSTAVFNLMANQIPEILAKLRILVFGGEVADPASIAKVAKFGIPNHFYNAYGPTETAVVTTAFQIDRLPQKGEPVPIGKPISNTKIYLLDEHHNPVPVGVPGEIYIGGKAVAYGYIGSKELTSFITDPFALDPSAKMYRSGDLGQWLPNGLLVYGGRIDGQIKIRGYRIELGEIESALKRHPDVRDAVVVTHGELSEQKQLAAYIIAEKKVFDQKQLRHFLQSKLPDYMVPNTIVTLEKFPMTSNGKVDRQALPEPIFRVQNESKIAPRTNIEQELMAIWKEAIGSDSIGVNDNFFDLGGNSLSAVHIITDVEKQFGKTIPISKLFEAPTIESLAHLIQENSVSTKASILVPIQPNGTRPPFFCLHDGFGSLLYCGLLSNNLGTDQPFYGFMPHDRSGSLMPYKTVESIATYYIEEMRKVQPNGPYYLGGYCISGPIAFEMAQQLQSIGQQVPLLVLFSSKNPRLSPIPLTAIERFRRRISRINEVSFSEKMATLSMVVRDSLQVRTSVFLKNFNTLLTGKKPSPEEIFGQETKELLLTAESAYYPQPYSGSKITIILPDRTRDDYSFPDDYGWTDVALEGTEIYETSGSHITMFTEKYVDRSAEILAQCIQKAYQESWT
jgi:amino acid adenylation domain-containing protein